MSYKVIIMNREETHNNSYISNLLKTFNGLNDLSFYKIDRYGLSYDNLIAIYDEFSTYYNEDDLLVLIDEKSSTSSTSEQFINILKYAKHNLNNEIDIFYFANFMDNCQNKKELPKSDDDTISHLKFYESKSPKGVFSIASSFKKWFHIIKILKEYEEIKLSSKLNKAIIDKHLKAATVWPRIFVPNIDTITDNLENYFTYPCRLENIYHEHNPKKQSTSAYWFFLGSIIVLLVYWILKFYLK